jgi:glycosyltransferase involved in cell wall biosynthesis
MLSVVVPVYRNEASIPDLLEELEGVQRAAGRPFEAVFVVDGSPDRSAELLAEGLAKRPFASQLLVLSRNFGSFAAIREGLRAARGDVCGVMAADLQEPPSLVLEMQRRLAEEGYDIALGVRESRADPIPSRLASAAFWWLNRLVVQREVPRGGVDVFAVTRTVRDHLMALPEQNSSLIGLLFWLGFRRTEVRYRRRPRHTGKSSWTFARKLRYSLDSLFAFTDWPIRILSITGLAGMALAIGLGLVVLWARLSGRIPVPGYAAMVLVVMFFGGLNSLSLGIVGEYVWRTFENTKGRPASVVARHEAYSGRAEPTPVQGAPGP